MQLIRHLVDWFRRRRARRTSYNGWMQLRFFSSDDDCRELGDDEVHVWSAPLDRSVDESLLTDAERERAGRFKMERIRKQFIAARAQLRLVLAGYLKLAPQEIRLATEPGGKPVLDSSHTDDLHFNLSHSETLAVYAITRRGRVGVDVERWRAIPNADDLVQRFFTPRDRELYLQLPDNERQAAFFRAWTRKEAVLKALGRGVQVLDRCEVTFHPDEPERVLWVEDDQDASGKWFLKSWRPDGEYVGAVAVEVGTKQ